MITKMKKNYLNIWGIFLFMVSCNNEIEISKNNKIILSSNSPGISTTISSLPQANPPSLQTNIAKPTETPNDPCGSDYFNVRASGLLMPKWSPDGKKISFLETYDKERPCGVDDTGDIYLLNLETGIKKQLTFFSNFDRYSPSGSVRNYEWSPNGGKISFTIASLFFIYNLETGNLIKVTDDFDWDTSPVWSPDSSRLAYLKSSKIYLVNADGSNSKELYGSIYSNDKISWSPDGKKLLFSQIHDGSILGVFYNLSIKTVDINGANQQEILVIRNIESSGNIRYLNWSPDGKKIIFSKYITNNENFSSDVPYDEKNGIYIMNSDGTEKKLLSEDKPFNINWSPDSSKIVYSFNPSESKTGICIIDIKDNKKSTIPDKTELYNPYPGWSPDGKKILFSSISDGIHSVYSINPDGSNKIKLISQEKFKYN